jgi:hypothetical protein
MFLVKTKFGFITAISVYFLCCILFMYATPTWDSRSIATAEQCISCVDIKLPFRSSLPHLPIAEQNGSSIYPKAPIRTPTKLEMLPERSVHRVLNHEVGPNLLCQDPICREKFSRDCDIRPNSNAPLVCIIVRTFVGHIGGDFDLGSLLVSFQMFHHQNWIALLTNTDGTTPNWPPYLRDLIAQDSRIVDLEFNASEYRGQDAGYFVSQSAIRHCPESTDWILLTNGDNLYHSQFLDDMDSEYDIIAHDFYSRYNNILNPDIYGKGCARFGKGSCKTNLVQLFHTDLGANLLNFKKFVCQNISFLDFLDDGCQDGQLMETLVYFSWKVKHIYKCHFYHAPNPEMCFSINKVWDDVLLHCIDHSAAAGMVYEGIRTWNEDVPFDCLESP